MDKKTERNKNVGIKKPKRIVLYLSSLGSVRISIRPREVESAAINKGYRYFQWRRKL